MSAPELLQALQPVAEAFERLGVPYYLGGSVASSLHGIFRTTADIDLVAALEAEHVESFVHALQDDYYIDGAMIRDALSHGSSFNLLHLPTMLKVDVFAVRERPFSRQSLARREQGPISFEPDAPTFWIASAEDTILAKLEWFRMGGETSERQWRDVLGVMKVQDDLLDLAYLHLWAREIGVADLLERALDEAGLGAS